MRVVVIMAMLLSGCATAPEYAARGAAAADDGLNAAEWYICRAASVGSILRRYGTSDDRMAAWRKLCTEVSSELK